MPDTTQHLGEEHADTDVNPAMDGTGANGAGADIADPERLRRVRNGIEGGIRCVVGVLLLVLQLNLWYDSNAWLQVLASLLGVYGIITGAGMLLKATRGSQTDPSTWFAVVWLAIVVLFVLLQLGGLFTDINANFDDRERPPSFTTDDPLGTDQLGKSMLNQSIRGARVSLIVGLGAVSIGLAVGTIWGMTAGYFRGKVEGVFNVITDSILAFPALILLFSIVAIFGSTSGSTEVLKIMLALAVLSIPTMARLSRANTLTFAAREFVTAARAMGAATNRIIFRELLPNVALPLISYAFIIIAVLIVAEASLSFLGVGIDPIVTPTWGNMISEGRDPKLLSDNPHIVFVPGVIMFLTVLSLNRVGEAMRNVWDTREAKL